MRQLAWAAAFLVFDRESGRPRPAAITGVTVVALTVASHLWLSGPWMRQAGFPDAVHAPAAAPTPKTSATCSTEASQR